MRYRLRIAVTIFFLALLYSGCLKYQTASARMPQAKPARPTDVALSEYIRTVLRLSTGNTAANDEALAQLHRDKPEIASLAQHVAANPDDLTAARSLAAAYLEEGFRVNAYQLFQQVQLRAPDDPEAHIGLALIWDAWKDYGLALQYASRAAALTPESAGALEALGRVYLHRNELDPALANFLAAIKVSPGSASLLANTGYVYILREDWENARRYLERAAAIDGSVPETRNNLGIVLARLGDREGALRQFLAVHDAAAAHNNLGVTYLGLGNYRLAQEEFRLALTANPDYERAALNLKEAESHVPPPAVYNIQPFPSRNPDASTRDGKGLVESAALQYHPITPLSLSDFMRKVFLMQVNAAASERPALYRPTGIAENPIAQNDEPPVIADFSMYRQISVKGLEAAEEMTAIIPQAATVEAAVVAAPAAPAKASRSGYSAKRVVAPDRAIGINGPKSARAANVLSKGDARSGYTIQLFSAKDEKAARADSEALAEKAGVMPAIERADLQDKGIWYRARIRGYESFNAALTAAKKMAVAGIIRGYWIVPPNF